MKYIAQIQWLDLPILVEGTYEPGRDNGYWDPPDPECFEVEKVMLGEWDITEVIEAANAFDEIEEVVLPQARTKYYEL